MIDEAGGVGRIRATIIESEKGAEQVREVGEAIDTTIVVELPVLHEMGTASDEEKGDGWTHSGVERVLVGIA